MAASTKTSIYADLPRVVVVDRRTDAGEFGAALCPHCGAEGRYIVHFRCEDGTRRGAMAGCFAKFPKHPLAEKVMYLLTKRDDYTKKGWSLPTWDQAVLDAANDFADGLIDEGEAMARYRTADAQRISYQSRKYGRRYR
jgi:hypothetical protein